MKTLFAVLILSIPSILLADVPTRIDDGKATFAYGQVGSTLAWNQSEYNSMVSQCIGSCGTQTFTPSVFEVSLSTTFVFKSYTDYTKVKLMSGAELDFAKDELSKEDKVKHFKKEKDK